MERIRRSDYIVQVSSLLGKGEAVVLTGHRRAGKSCILELLAAELSPKGNVIYIDMENPENADIQTFRELSERIKDAVVEGRRNFVLIDEVQEVAEFEKALRYWVNAVERYRQLVCRTLSPGSREQSGLQGVPDVLWLGRL